MKRFALFGWCLVSSLALMAQNENPKSAVSPIYRSTPEKINDLVHTRLDARFDYLKAQLIGKVWITLKPHFYSTDSLALDAKGMEIKEVALVQGSKSSPLKYDYDGMILDVHLNKLYKNNEEYTIYINYIAKPNEYKGQGSAAITDAKGLYFINPTGADKNIPTQIWTQGETEATSVWVPTIDKPNQKTTEEIIMTVPSKYVTLSNGLLVNQKNNSDGTRTDNWKMDLPHSPYLFFMGVGDYAVIKDKYKNKEVSYYVEKEYAPVARKIFGNTPEMMAFYSRITGVDFPWQKYAQIVGREYVSGAMENTTATLHQESAQQDARQLTDGNAWEKTIAHELFHQWFGDYVTTESWSNLTLNESFANYSEYLWTEYKYGKDAADEHNYTDMQGYLASNSEQKNLVRFYYNDKEDMFDAVSYNKGGRILNMLRNYVGDSAFFKSLNLYLTSHKFGNAEAQELRLAFEHITGKDLNWFWNEWYYGNGHPVLNITYNYNEATKRVDVLVEQNQTTGRLFQFPVQIDVWNGTTPKRYTVWAKNKVDTFSFEVPSRPELVNFDAQKALLAKKTENKSLEQYLFQYKHAQNYLDRREAIDAALKKASEPVAVQILQLGLQDRYEGLRSYTAESIDVTKDQVKAMAEPILFDLAQKDPSRKVKASAIGKLGDYASSKYADLFKKSLNDSSYSIAGNALGALDQVDSATAYNEAKRLSAQPAKGDLLESMTMILAKANDQSSAEVIFSNFADMPMTQAKFNLVPAIIHLLAGNNNPEVFKKGVDAIMSFEQSMPGYIKDQASAYYNNMLRMVQRAKATGGQMQLADYIGKSLTKGF